MEKPYPSYLNLYRSGRLKELAQRCQALLESCQICPRKCKIDRKSGQTGYCATSLKIPLYSYMGHNGEEPPISAERGSGTIFFSRCNMKCVYCQNFEFSQSGQGKEVEPDELSVIMLKLQALGCHNINLVTPTHVMPQILLALDLAAGAGLRIPLVYNTGGYESDQIIRLLDGVVDIYLTDMRYGDPAMALKYSGAIDYPRYNQEAVKEMHRQVGIAAIDGRGVLQSGLVIRHLVLPSGISGTEAVMRFIATEISRETFISLMSQYTPYYKAGDFKEIARQITLEEYEKAQEAMARFGLYNGWTQEGRGLESLAGVHIRPLNL